MTAATNDFVSHLDNLTAPAAHWFAVTPSDSTDMTHATRGILVGTSGNVAVNTVGGESSVTIYSLVAGIVHPIRATRVLSTGTTAANIVGCY